MDLVEKMIIKKGSINLSDLQMIKFQIEMDKPSIDYHNKSLTVSPLSSCQLGFKKAKDGRLDVVAKAVAFLIKTEYGRGAKNDFIKAFKKSL